MKKKLIDSLKALPMTMEDKEKFAEVVLSNKGSNAGGFDEYYYIFNKPTVFGDYIGSWVNILNGAIGVSHVIIDIDGKKTICPVLEGITTSKLTTYALMLTDIPVYYPIDTYAIKYQGDIVDRYITTYELSGNELTYEEAKNIVDQYLTPISKEEFFALNELEIK